VEFCSYLNINWCELAGKSSIQPENKNILKLKKDSGTMETAIVMSAHSDDFVIGAGGTIAKYVKEGKKVLALIFSYGEKSHPWLKKKVVRKMREKETHDAAAELGCEVLFFDMGDQKVYEDYQKMQLEKDFLKILNKEKPTKIFTHSGEDPHGDHKAVHKITLELIKKLKFKPELYIYSIWNPVSFKTNFPTLYVDVSKTFSKKLKASHLFRSQRINAIYPLMTLIFHRAIIAGLKLRKKFGESFYRIK
jgi:LmbE family N-acetylglucosaminyl deacetylase